MKNKFPNLEMNTKLKSDQIYTTQVGRHQYHFDYQIKIKDQCQIVRFYLTL